MNPKPAWRVVCHPAQTAEMNMAIDEAISIAFSHGEGPPTLRLYRWSKPSLSIGSFQKIEPAWADLVKVARFPLVRRITGGRALLHDREMTYAVVAGTRDPLFSEGIKGTFFAIARGLLAGLEQLGVEAELHTPPRWCSVPPETIPRRSRCSVPPETIPRRSRRRPERGPDPLCFASTSWYEITARGKKLIGSAQKRSVSHFLQHGSLILEKNTTEGPLQRFISDHQIALSDLLPAYPPDKEMDAIFIKGFERALRIELAPGDLTEEEMKTADRLAHEKYGNDAWNWRRETEAGK